MKQLSTDFESFNILNEGIDFFESSENVNRGTRAKKYVVTKSGEKAIFKYDDGRKFRGSEDCSEKIASELAKKLGYKSAKIDLAVGKNGEIGLLSYLFVDPERDEIHEDMEDFLDINRENESTEYTIKKIEEIINVRFPDLDFRDFIRIIFFDALVGERDRHIGNWGITTFNDGTRKISPLYDTASCLLRDLKNEKLLNSFINGVRDINSYINKNTLAIYKDDSTGQYVPTESVIDYLLENYYDLVFPEIHNLTSLNNDTIEEIVLKIPDTRMNNMHKKFVIEYLISQRDKIIEKGERYEQ